MKKLLVLAAIPALLLFGGCAHKCDVEAARAAASSAVERYVEAVKNDDLEAFSAVTAHDAGMVNIGTSAQEYMVGWEALKKLMERQFALTETTALKVREKSVRAAPSGETAWFSMLIDWDVEMEGESYSLKGLRATGVLEKRDGEWLVVQTHFSIPDQTGAPEN